MDLKMLLTVLCRAAVGTLCVMSTMLVPVVDASPAQRSLGSTYARIDIDQIGPQALAEIKTTSAVHWWVELDDRLLVLAEEMALEELQRQFGVERLLFEPHASRLFFVRGAGREELSDLHAEILATGGRFAVMQARFAGEEYGGSTTGASESSSAEFLPFRPNLVLASQLKNRPNLPTLPFRSNSSTEGLDEFVDEQRWFNDVVAFASYNRYTHGSAIDDARDWLVEQLGAMNGLTVQTESFQVGGTTAWNVVATLLGSVRPNDLYIVGGHYDSTSQSPQTAAPGAEDNASGCAGVLEMARIFSAHPPGATILFICYSGEEQGLFGSSDHASGLVASGLDDQVEAVLIMDMVGFTEDSDLDCLLETNSANAALVDIFAAAASVTELRIVISFNPFGSDHVPYLNRGMPALLVIENDWDTYPCYHSTCDLPANLTLAMGREILEMNVLALSQMAGFGSAIFADGFESGDLGAWDEIFPSP